MRRLSPVAVFALSAFAWLLVLTTGWTFVSKWTSRPVAALSILALENGASGWVRTMTEAPGRVEVESEFQIFIPNSGGRRGSVVVDGDPSRYSYGLPIFLALLLAARGPRRPVRALAGYLLLLPAQAASLSFYLLMQLVTAGQGSSAALRAPQWQLESIAYGFQLGVLVLPTLVPVLIWLWLDRQFVNDVLVRGWQKRFATPA